MDFQDFICDKLRAAGYVKAKKMFGTYNICLDGVNLGVLCLNKWYLKKTAAGDAYIKENGIALETGIKDNSYIVTDFSDEKKLCELAKVTRDEIMKMK
jgi:TfoX/Sxy family transcriptional regulator of competence genes